MKIITNNRKAHYNYFLKEKYEAGIILFGTEVKSLMHNGANISESYVALDGDGNLCLINAHIPHYWGGNINNHEPTRMRRLLLHRKEINKIASSSQAGSYTAVPLKMYFDQNHKVKVEIAIVQGKKQFDKRETIKQREWNREKARVLKGQVA